MLKHMIAFLFAFVIAVPLYLHADEDTDKAWQAFDKKDFVSARVHTQNCFKARRDKAISSQAELRQIRAQNSSLLKAFQYQVISAKDRDNDIPGAKEIIKRSDLNDVATSQFIEAEILAKEGKKEEAKKYYKEIADSYPDGYCWDPKGWYWKVSNVAQDRLETMDTKYDYGDYKSETLTGKSWQALKDKDAKGIILYANKCIKLYDKDALGMLDDQSKLGGKGQESQNWALNDVATCYYILGEKALKEGNYQEAKSKFGEAAKLGLGSCWDPRGWYWKVGDVAQDKIDTMGTNYDYEDYRSVTLMVKAWKALTANDYKGVELYTNKCIYLYSQKANEMQGTMKSYAKKSFIPYFWALNDVGTCYFIQAESYLKQGNTAKAKESYQTVINQYGYSQCWDPRGWYWKVAEISQKKLDQLK